jgi:hypothetical protein
MKNQSQGQVRHLLGFRLGQRRRDAVGIAGEATPPRRGGQIRRRLRTACGEEPEEGGRP